MFKPSILKTIAYIALVCCALGILFTIFEATVYHSWRSYLNIISWALLLYSSFLATRLSTYDLYEEDMKKLGLYIYGILVLFVLFLILNLSLGILPAIFLAIGLHNQKTGFDSWMKESKEKEETDKQII
ncbi:MAG TPA: hypothetical protein VK609_18420 [Mucilaginibacter sp.]|nr:hypothetical protein [Mucilaginibacter sp.]